MEQALEKIKSIIDKSQNIALVSSSEKEEDSFPATLALFYSLKKIGKNVNFINSDFPKKYNFLIKRGVFRSPQADFLISIKGQDLRLSQLFYEKTKNSLNLYLKTNSGVLKKENISFDSLNSELVITVGIKNFENIKKILVKESCNFVININNQLDGSDFGQAKLIKTDYSSLSEIIFDFLATTNKNLFDNDIANSLLAGIIQGSSNLQDKRISSQTFQKISFLIEKGANFQKIISELYQPMRTPSSFRIFQRILNKINFSDKQKIGWLIIDHNDFQETNSAPSDLSFTLEKLNSPLFPFQSFFCLWQNISPPLFTKGVFYSPNEELLGKVQNNFKGLKKGNGLLFQTKEKNARIVKDKILEIIGTKLT